MEAYRPLRGKDENNRGFAHNAVVQTLANDVAEIGFEDFSQALRRGDYSLEHIPEDDGGPNWEPYITKEIVESGTGNCLDVGWFFMESYAHRRMIGFIDYFLPDNAGHLVDPWYEKKEEALDSAINTFKIALSSDDDEPSLRTLLLWSLWSSSAKKSADQVMSLVESDQGGLLLVNDLALVEREFLRSTSNSSSTISETIIIVLDKCGLELLTDLRLAAHLAQERRVELHVKSYPCYRTACTKKDVQVHIDRLYFDEDNSGRLGQVLRDLVESSRIEIIEDDFYSSPLEFSQAPEPIKERYAQAKLVILKGDIAYRRLLGDRNLPASFPFKDVVARVTPSPLLALRVCRSPLICGVHGAAERKKVQGSSKEWCVDESFGVIQYSHGTTQAEDDIIMGEEEVTLVSPRVDQEAAAYEHPTARRRGSDLDSADYSLGEQMDDDQHLAEHLHMDEQLGEMVVSPREEAAVVVPAQQSTKKRAATTTTTTTAKQMKQQTVDGNKAVELENDDVLQDADEILWMDSTINNPGIDAYMDELGTKDPRRPPIHMKLPERALSGFEYYCQTRPNQHPDKCMETWVSMTKAQKSQFEATAAIDKARYEKELIAKAVEVARIIDAAVKQPSS